MIGGLRRGGKMVIGQHITHVYASYSQRTCACLLLLLMSPVAVLTLTIKTTSSDQELNDTCLPTCTSLESKIECKGCIPEMVKNKTEISLVEISPLDLIEGRFCYVRWSGVIKLSITTADNMYFSLEYGVFDCLENLKYFRLSSPFLEHFDALAFRGLSNLTEFDLTGCNRMYLDDLRTTLTYPDNFPSLSRIVLSSICFALKFPISKNFIDALAVRPIRYIDLSHNKFQFQFSNSGTLCDHLDTLIIRDAEFYCDNHCQRHTICNSLRVYDMSGTIDIFKSLTCRNASFRYGLHRFFQAVRILFSNEVIKQPLTQVVNCSLRLLYNTLVEEFHFSENQLPLFEFKLVNDRFKFLNLSYNKIQKIHPDAIKDLPSLNKVDLSHNDLSKANALQNLFKHSKNLREVDLSANNFETLPNETFISNSHLELLNLSFNSFSQIHFHFWNLLNLRTIDLRINAVTSLDAFSRSLLDEWLKFHLQNNLSVNVLLAGNPLSCNCSSLEFLKWFVTSPIFARAVRQYYCTVDNQKIQMTHAVTAAQENCDKPRRQKLLTLLGSTLAPFCLLVTSVIAIFIFRRQRRKRQARLFYKRIRLLRENNSADFLSYCSDDNDFVTQNILPTLEEELRNVTRIDRDLVSYADRHFVPGRTIMSEMMRCLEECPVFVAVISEAFCASRFCRHEIETAHTEGKPIILILKEHVPEDKMDPVTRKIFRNFTRVKCVFGENGVDLQPGWKHLCKSIIELIEEKKINLRS